MKKKGIAPAVIIIMIVGVLVGLVVIYAIAFPGQLASKMRDALFSLGLGRLPEERMPSLETRVTGAVYLCKDEKCLDIPPSHPWRKIPESGVPGCDNSPTDEGDDCISPQIEIRASGLDPGKKCCEVQYCEGPKIRGQKILTSPDFENWRCPQGFSQYSREVSNPEVMDGTFTCCSDDSIGEISNICNEEPSPEDSSDSESPYDKICGKIGSVAITESYNVRLYEHENYLGATICIVQSVNLKKYGWNKKTKSVKLFESGECETQG